MRRVGLPVIAVIAVLLTAAAPALGAPSPAPSAQASALPTPVPAATPGKVLCTISSTSTALSLTGLTVLKDGTYVAVSGGDAGKGGTAGFWKLAIVYLDKTCKKNGAGAIQTYNISSATGDPQDVAVDKAGALWIADSGDVPVNPTRTDISLWKITSRSDGGTHYKFRYGDGGAHNTEALIMTPTGQPIFVTRENSGPASIFTFTGKLTTASTMQLLKVGTFQPEQTGTANKLGTHGLAQNSITGGAMSPDGKHVALRTLSDAYEWDVTNNDVVNALLKGTPRITPLPNENDGSAIAYTPDGSFVTLGYSADDVSILEYTPSKPIVATKPATNGHGVKGIASPSALRKWFNSLTLNQLMLYLGIVALFGALLVVLGILGIRRARKNAPPPAKKGSGASKPVPAGAVGGAAVGGAAVGGAAVGGAAVGGVYGGARGPGGGPGYPDSAPHSPAGYDRHNAPAGGVYGGRPQGGGGVYGGSAPAAPPPGVYGGGQYGGSAPAPQPGPPPGVYGGGQYGNPPGGYPPPEQHNQGGGVYGGGGYAPPADPYEDDDRRSSPYGRDGYR